MIKILLSTFLLSMTNIAVFAQDTIYTKSGKIILAEIISKDSTGFRFYTDDISEEIYMKKEEVSRIGRGMPNYPHKSEAGSVGLGLGLDYGGIGVNLQACLGNSFALSAGVGNSFAGLGYNVGIKVKKNAEKATNGLLPYATLLYGINSIIYVQNMGSYNKMFAGVTPGLGLDIRLSKRSLSCLSIGLIFPIRKPQVQQYIDELKSKGVVFGKQLQNVAISVGFRFGIRKYS
jgi:hypothetical protein